MPASRPISNTWTARALTAFAAIALLAACSTPQEPDYREKYAIGVEQQTVATAVRFNGNQDPLAGEDGARLDAMVSSYLDRGHGPLTIAVGPTTRADAGRQAAQLAAVRDRLIRRGVPASVIQLAHSNGDVPIDTVMVRFQRFDVSVPNCGDWSAPPSFNPYNQAHPNFGCAQQHNIGLMAADPADLAHMRDGDSTDSQRAGLVIQNYRAGKPTPATSSAAQSSSSIVSIGGNQ
ncbi:MAG TPA: CpaD family pilus assembly lipoprotein [Candidatus Cybelea sp.]|nr:CpaD family pilus assembly lipoprotein [Candidatus Cybelea sp.]